MVCRVGDTDEQESPRTILVEFGNLTDEQHMLLDLHTLRALGDDLSVGELKTIVSALDLSKLESMKGVGVQSK